LLLLAQTLPHAVVGANEEKVQMLFGALAREVSALEEPQTTPSRTPW